MQSILPHRRAHPLIYLYTIGLFLCVCVSSCCSKVIDGSVYSSSRWQYLDRFCFDQSGGRIILTMTENPALSGENMIAIYADISSSWPAVYGFSGPTDGYSDQSWAALTDAQRDVLLCNYKINDTTHSRLNIGVSAIANIPYPISVTSYGRPRWWYIALANCNGPSDSNGNYLGISNYDIQFLNSGGIFYEQFSTDEQTEYQMCIFFFIYFSLYFPILIYWKKHAKDKKMQYQTIKILFIAICFEWLSALCYLADHAQYANDGKGYPHAAAGGYFFQTLAQICLLMLILFISRGWPVSTNYISQQRLIILVLFCLLWVYTGCYLWFHDDVDPALVLYIFETPPGYTVVAIHIVIAIWVAYNIIQTHNIEKDASKRLFYRVFGMLCTLWVLALPFIVLIAAEGLDDWNRSKVVFGIQFSVDALYALVTCYFFRPYRSNRFVSILNPAESRAFGQFNLQIFPALPQSETFTSF